MISKLIDNLMELLVVPSYTKLGFEFRKNNFFENIEYDASNLVICVTGCTSGLGLALCKALASMNASLVLVARNKKKVQHLEKELSNITEGSVNSYIAELSDVKQVHLLAEKLQSLPKLTTLVNNAGYLATGYEVNAQGIEKSFAVNCLAGFILTDKLKDKLSKNPYSSIINVSSGGMYTQRINVKNLEKGNRPFNGVIAYAQAKRAQVILNRVQSQSLSESGIFTAAMHPGWAGTPGVESSLPGFFKLFEPILRNPEQGMDTILYLITKSDLASGSFWFDREARKEHIFFWTKEGIYEEEQLVATCKKLALNES
jgi:dehydrogenase/reductase SDR family member 12